MSVKKSQGSIVIGVLLVFVGIVVAFFLLFRMNQIIGSDGSIFANNQTYLFEKVTYLFNAPQIGDIVLFRYRYGSSEAVDYIGAVVKIENLSDGELTYSLANRVQPKGTFQITREDIVARAVYPQTRLEYDTVNKILINLQGNKGGQK